MKSFSFAQALIAGSLLCLALPMACGDSEENPNPTPGNGGESSGGEPGRGGEPAAMGGDQAMAGAPMLPPGISDMPSTIECSESCSSAEVGVAALGQLYYVDPCCAGANEDACGLDTTFLASTGASFDETCQPKDQPGDLDEACPETGAATIPFGTFMAPLSPFPGCCRPNGTCGVQVNEIVVMLGAQAAPVGNLELGCVDAAPFFPDADPIPCGAGVGGAGGAGPVGGAPTVVGGDGAGGASGGVGGAN